MYLNYGIPALHFESPRWFRKLEQFKTAPTRGRNTVPDPSVGVVSFMSPHKRQLCQQPIHRISWNNQLCLAVFHLFCTVEHHHPQGGSDRAHQKFPLYRNGADTQTITIEPIFQLIEILLNHPALPVNGKRFKRIGNAVASKSKIPRRFDCLIDFAWFSNPFTIPVWIFNWINKTLVVVPKILWNRLVFVFQTNNFIRFLAEEYGRLVFAVNKTEQVNVRVQLEAPIVPKLPEASSGRTWSDAKSTYLFFLISCFYLIKTWQAFALSLS